MELRFDPQTHEMIISGTSCARRGHPRQVKRRSASRSTASAAGAIPRIRKKAIAQA
jgi:hypothetical protein